MTDKAGLLGQLNEEFERWESLLARLNEQQRVAPELGGGWSVKDVLAHLMAWQQLSIARLEAARDDREPVLPDWTDGQDPEDYEQTDVFNGRIYDTYRDQPWAVVFLLWRDGFLRFMELGTAVPETDLFDTAKYPWLNGYALADVLEGSYGHHREEHREPLEALLGQ